MTQGIPRITNIQHPDEAAKIRGFLDKIVINAGIGRASSQGNFEDKILPQILRDLALISGQKPEVRRAKKSIAGFKIREGQIIGVRITLRGQKMVDFFNRLVTIVLPRVRDFAGLEEAIIDQGGALHIGFKEQFVFPEVNPEESLFIFSLAAGVIPRIKNRVQAVEFYRLHGVPLKAHEATQKKHKK